MTRLLPLSEGFDPAALLFRVGTFYKAFEAPNWLVL
jgi:hypothetical protein